MSPKSQQKVAVTSTAALHTKVEVSSSRPSKFRSSALAINFSAADPVCGDDKRRDHCHEDQAADEQGSAVVPKSIGHLKRDIGGQRTYRIEQAVRSAYHVPADHQNGHGLAYSPASLKDDAGEQAGFGRRENDPPNGCPARQPQRGRATYILLGHVGETGVSH